MTKPVLLPDMKRRYVCKMIFKDGSHINKIVKPSHHHECRRFPPLKTRIEQTVFHLREWDPESNRAVYHEEQLKML